MADSPSSISGWSSIADMMDDNPQITELDNETVETLVQRARQTTYYTHLVEFLSKRLGEKIPKNHTQAFEREDGHQVVAITDSTDQASLPRVGITFVFDGEDVTHAVAEVNYNAESNKKQKLIYPDEFTPDSGTESENSSTINTRKFEKVTVHEIEFQ